MIQPQADFEHACQDAINGLRAAFVQLYDSVDADPLSPQDVARRFGVNKTLTWNVSRLMQAPDGLAAVTHLPGRAAIEKILSALERCGAGDEAIEGVRSAADAFDEVVKVHLGDRGTLDLVLDAMDTPATDGLERSRKLAFRGNSGLFGVQAKTRLNASFLAPSAADPDRLDLAQVSGYAGFRRLRSASRWPLFRPRGWASDEHEPIASAAWQPIAPNGDASRHASIMTEFSRGALPATQTVATPFGTDIILEPGPVGNPGAFDCYRGEHMRSAASRYRTDTDAYGEFGVTITTPTEYLVADLIVHETLEFALRPEVVVYARQTPPQGRGPVDDHLQLPIRPAIMDLPGRPPAVATPLVPQYTDVLRTVFENLDWDPSRFRGVRLQMPYPPLGTMVMLRFGLPGRG